MSFLAVPRTSKPNAPLASTHLALVNDDSTPVFSRGSALFSAMARTQPTYFQWLAHSFPSHGGGGDRWSARSILRVYPESRRARAVASERPAHSTLVYPERFVRRA